MTIHTNESTSTTEYDVVAGSSVNGNEAMAEASFLVNSMMVPMMMNAAIDLGILDILAGAGHLTAAEVAGKLPAEENPQVADVIERILRFLTVFSVVSCSIETPSRRVYGLTAVGKYFVKNEDGVSLASALTLVTGKVFIESCYKIKEAILDGGIAFNKAHGMNAFEYPAIDPKFNDLFNNVMLSHTTILMKELLQSYNGFETVNQIVDVGGGLGHTLKIILTKYPKIRAINFDLPHVTVNGLSHPGMEQVGGDMFEVIPNTETIFMKWILHDWSDELCIKLLKNCYNAIPDNGKVIVVELVVLEDLKIDAATKATTVLDMMMMTQNPGGKERTKMEFVALATTTGFKGIKFECCVGNFWVMELYK